MVTNGGVMYHIHLHFNPEDGGDMVTDTGSP
jgi:hypothetical protein